MHEADTLTALADDLRALPARERRAVLSVLAPYERAQVAALIDVTEIPASGQAAAPDYSRFSPWLARHLSVDADGAGDRNLTAATRRLLAEAAAEISPAPSQQVREPEPRRRSFADAVGQLLFPRQALR